MTVKLIDAVDLMARAEAQQRLIDELVRIENGHIVFTQQNYWIDLKQVRTHKKLVAWTEHLLGKEWMTRHMLRAFITKVGKANGLNIYGC